MGLIKFSRWQKKTLQNDAVTVAKKYNRTMRFLDPVPEPIHTHAYIHIFIYIFFLCYLSVLRSGDSGPKSIEFKVIYGIVKFYTYMGRITIK